MKTKDILLAFTRISLGWIFFWSFLDKTFGLGFSTAQSSAWINGGSPTAGFLGNAVRGPFAEQFGSLAGQGWVDWVFMLGLLLIGVALLLGIAMRLAGIGGALMMFLMYLAVMPLHSQIPPPTNPFMDYHIVYGLVLLIFASQVSIGDTLGIGKGWRRSSLVSKLPILK